MVKPNSIRMFMRTTQPQNIRLGIPGTNMSGNDRGTYLYFRRTLKTGISVEALEGGDQNGIIVSGESQIITLKSSPKFPESQQIVHFFLLNQTLPGWLYFEKSLTNQSEIKSVTEFGEKEYKVHILPNRTGEQRSVTLQICDRGMTDTVINYTITQNSTILSTNKTLRSVVPILSKKIDGPDRKTVEVLSLYTWEEQYSINGGEYITRTYREMPSYSQAEVRIDEGDWLTVKRSNSKNYLEIYSNPEDTPRIGRITLIAKDELGNTVTGSLKLFQPGYSSQINRSLSNIEIRPIDVGLAANKPVPLEIYNIGYTITGTRTISYGEGVSNVFEETGELFPESLEDLKVSCGTHQTFNLSTPLSLIAVTACS